MSDVIASIGLLALCCAGLGLLSVGMDRHADVLDRWGGATLWRRSSCRVLGSLLLIASLAGCIDDLGASIGPVVWCGWLSVAVVVVTAAWTYAPRRASPPHA